LAQDRRSAGTVASRTGSLLAAAAVEGTAVGVAGTAVVGRRTAAAAVVVASSLLAAGDEVEARHSTAAVRSEAVRSHAFGVRVDLGPG